MSLDTKYRPLSPDDVLGQKNSIKITRRFISTGAGFRQSYLFAGQFGSGKTTLGRILARGLLCENPSGIGDPCNKCPTCRALIEIGTCQEYVEVDAATNSGKADIKKIIEEIQYTTFSGRQRIYLFDEAHQLSRDALDAMLKPMEENVPGTENKKLVCIFCTTEPEKMRSTILSRCAPAFVIEAVPPKEIAGRLEYICQQEGLKYDFDVLTLISESVECHIRDAIKAIEGVSMLGDINMENVVDYLRLDLNTAYLDVLENLGKDLPASVDAIKRILERTSPVTCYEKLADVTMMVYHASLGAVKPPNYWDADRVKAISDQHGINLLSMAKRFASRPTRATRAMLLCDVGLIHHGGGAVEKEQVVYLPSPIQASIPVQEPVVIPSSTENIVVPEQKPETGGKVAKVLKSPALNGGGVYVDARAVGKCRSAGDTCEVSKEVCDYLTPADFERLLGLRLRELDVSSGYTRRVDMGGSGIVTPGGNKG